MFADSPERYALSFTSGGLLMREAAVLSSLYLAERDWGQVRKIAVERNVLQARTSSSSVRVIRETVQRLSVLTDAEIDLLADAGPSEQQILMWAAACRRYGLIGEFAEEVVRERFLLMTPSLSTDDFDRFLVGKSLWHPELNALKPSTSMKLRQNVFRMLQDAGLLTESGNLVPAVMSERVIDTLNRRTPSDIRFFPTTTSAGAEQ
ncbi:DUF1819 family protein [Microbacterium sp. SD291]|uniref:DUF1819 family protein n=1 Tax=Microbacterium sp. SD291 TaxID=2782007 RepID=UPI0027DB3EB1|nr:DUF1819 family protein [Microbacterium sp. SD291]